MRSFLSHLECTSCGAEHDAAQLITTCPACGKVLYARYDLASAGDSDLRLQRRPTYRPPHHTQALSRRRSAHRGPPDVAGRSESRSTLASTVFR